MMNTTGDMSKIVDVSYAGSGNSGSADLTIPQVLKTKKHVGTIDRATKWWELGLRNSPVPVIADTKAIESWSYVLDWQNSMVGEALGAVVWTLSGPKEIAVSSRALPTWQATVALWHELGHIYTMDKLKIRQIILYPSTFSHEWAEIAAWQWAKNQLRDIWDNEAEQYALNCLKSYGINRGEIV